MDLSTAIPSVNMPYFANMYVCTECRNKPARPGFEAKYEYVCDVQYIHVNTDGSTEIYYLAEQENGDRYPSGDEKIDQIRFLMIF